MNDVLIFLFGFAAGGAAVWIYFNRRQHSNILQNVGMLGNAGNEEGQGLIERQAKEKEENLRKIMAFFERQERVTNDEVEKALGVSHATATNYFDELESRKKIRQVGKTGMGVYYEKTG